MGDEQSDLTLNNPLYFLPFRVKSLNTLISTKAQLLNCLTYSRTTIKLVYI